MSTYHPAEGLFVGRPPCANCGAAFRLHRNPVLDERPLEQHEPKHPCPQAYRPGSLAEAERQLAEAEASGDPARVFVARGEVQRLRRRP